ncbi:MAG TPA: MBL fold metallo-hydrolase [Opitutaceae bacterium]|nr:MBL fold metallo-hydrolase [Opitutaceae bacterium]
MISVTVLVENTARGARHIGEHGLAYWIETPLHRVLFDTGQGLALAHNALVRGVDLAAADAIVLSHGHYDHVGGLQGALQRARHAALYFHPRVTEAKFIGPTAPGRRISLPYIEQEFFRSAADRVVATAEPVEVVPGIRTTGEIPRTNRFEDTGGPFYLDADLTTPDPLLDDQAVYFDTRDGLVVLLGCAHAGVVNTLEHVAHLTGRAAIHAVVGGMHLENASERRLEETVAALRRFQVQRLGPMHCTGWKAVGLFQREFAAEYAPCAVGTIWHFETVEMPSP